MEEQNNAPIEQNNIPVVTTIVKRPFYKSGCFIILMFFIVVFVALVVFVNTVIFPKPKPIVLSPEEAAFTVSYITMLLEWELELSKIMNTRAELFDKAAENSEMATKVIWKNNYAESSKKLKLHCDKLAKYDQTQIPEVMSVIQTDCVLACVDLYAHVRTMDEGVEELDPNKIETAGGYLTEAKKILANMHVKLDDIISRVSK